MTSDEIYMIANAALSGIIIFPTIILSFFSCFQAHKRNDPARNGVSWVKLTYPFFFLSLVLTVAADASYIVILTGDDGSGGLFEASNYLSLISGFLENLASIYALVAMLEIGLGFFYIQKPPRGTAVANNNSNDANKDAHIIREDGSDGTSKKDHYKVVHIAAGFFAVLLLALAVALLGKACNAYAVYYRDINASSSTSDSGYTAIVDRYIAAIRIARDLGATFDIIIWVLAFPLVGFACYLVHHARLQNQPSLNATVLFLLATIFWFIRFTWHLVYHAAWLLPSTSHGAPIWFDIADPILNAWLFFIVLLFLYIIVARRARGLWSTSQPWMLSGAGNVQGGASYYQPVYNPGYGYQPQQVHQLPGNEQQHFQNQTFHEMYQPQQQQQQYQQQYQQQQVPANPQEMYAPHQYVQQYQGHPQGGVGSPQPTVSSPTVQATPSPAPAYSNTPPNDVKS
ncbi:hypothetical protein SBRCBS47491_006463 [Sporothrix bragantina]|uniref:Uncharacterized protein n=1 Tax=Sporothrix bragantina TaxID=671064 RepID=A0ABP0C501_9PEZI